MKIHYNITKEQRKKLVEVVGKALGKQPVYCGTPTFSYRVGEVEITPDGSICSEDAAEVERVRTALLEAGEETIKFAWFHGKIAEDTVRAYTDFISKLCEMAQKQKRAVAKEKPTENEKYAFRCFLLRLGMIGDDYKTSRRILLQNLTGSSAFKCGHRKEEANREVSE